MAGADVSLHDDRSVPEVRWFTKLHSESFMLDVTVAIPTYNRTALLRTTIESVLNQDGVSFEAIVFDNASTDGTPEMVESFDDPRLRIERSPTNVGLIGNFNRALSAGTAPLLTVLHDDDVLLPGSLALRAELLRSDESMVVAYSNYGVIDQYGIRTREVYRTHIPSGSIEQPFDFLRAALHGEVRCHMSAALIRRALLADVRCHEEDGSFTDHGLWMRLACNGSFGLLPLRLLDVRVHASAGSEMGNFQLDANGTVVPNATEQVVRTLGVARRVLRDPSLNVPHRPRLRVLAEIEGVRQLAPAVAADLAVPANSVSRIVLRAVRALPAIVFSPSLLRAVGLRARNRVIRPSR